MHQPSFEMGAGVGIVSSMPTRARGHQDNAADSVGQRSEEAGVADDGSVWRFTFAINADEAYALIRGDVPPGVQHAVISMIVSAAETPAEAVASMKRRRAR